MRTNASLESCSPEVELRAPLAQETVTAVIRHNVKLDARGSYEDWLRRIIPVAASFPGHLGVNVIRPASGVTAYAVTLRFVSLPSAQRWLESSARKQLLDEASAFLVDAESIQTVAGLEFWFDAPPGPPRVRKYKQFMLAMSAIFPLTFIVQWSLGDLIDQVPMLRHPVAHRFVLTAIMVALMTYVVMPRYSQLAGRWLYR